MLTFSMGHKLAEPGAVVIFVVITHAELQRFSRGEPMVLPIARLHDALAATGKTLDQTHSVQVYIGQPGEDEMAIITKLAATIGRGTAEITVVDRRAHAPGRN